MNLDKNKNFASKRVQEELDAIEEKKLEDFRINKRRSAQTCLSYYRVYKSKLIKCITKLKMKWKM